MKKLLILIIAISSIAAIALPKTCTPAPRGSWWPNYHKNMLKRESKNGKVLFLGDSITMMWRSQSGYEGGTKVWNKYYQKLPAANYGISGDKTENILWRITSSDDLRGTNPKVVVLLIGINNLNRSDSPKDTASGISEIVKVLRQKLPQSKILLMAVFPCWKSPKHPTRNKVKATNNLIKPLADNKKVFYLDIGKVFLEKDGSISKKILRDYLHLSEKGYQRWAKAMQPTLIKLLQEK
jgi:lysophospholipase L1-like esterase